MTLLWPVGLKPWGASGDSTDAQRREGGTDCAVGVSTRGCGQTEVRTSRLSTTHASLHLVRHLATEGPEAVTAQLP